MRNSQRQEAEESGASGPSLRAPNSEDRAIAMPMDARIGCVRLVAFVAAAVFDVLILRQPPLDDGAEDATDEGRHDHGERSPERDTTGASCNGGAAGLGRDAAKDGKTDQGHPGHGP